MEPIIEEDDSFYFDDLADRAESDVALIRSFEEKLRQDAATEHRLDREAKETEVKRDSIFEQASAWMRGMWASLGTKADDGKAKGELEKKQAELDELKATAEARCRAAKESLELHRKSLQATREQRSTLCKDLRSSKIASLAKRARRSASGDVVFVMDCTGSMSGFMSAAAEQCCRIIDRVRAEGGTVGACASTSAALSVRPGTQVPLFVRFGFVAYRDYDDGQLHLQAHDLSDDAESVKRFIANLAATGGGDGPEDVVGGLRIAARQLSWMAQHRTVFLFADAPNHGRLLHDASGDSYPDDPRTKQAEQDIPGIMGDLRKGNTDFFFVRINASYTNKMEAQLRSFFNAGAGGMTGAQFNTFDLNSSAAGFFEAVGDRAVASVSRSFTTSMTSARKGARALVGPPPALDTSPPAWPKKADCDPSQPVSAWKVPTGWEVLEAELSFCFMARFTDSPTWSTRKAKLLYRRTPFACGAMRAAYYFYDPEWDEQLVGKRYIGPGATAETYDADIHMQHYAQCLAKDANLRLSKGGVQRAFSFVLPWKLHSPRNGQIFSMEYMLQGEYKKWNNNNGWLDDSAGGLMAAAFSHFSHVMTSGQAMVVDIQGVNGWCFTDPQVHSTDRKAFGVGNLGEHGMASFYLTHQCSTYCRLLGARSERPELQPIQATREVRVGGDGPVAFCAVCGCSDVEISPTELARKAERRHDLFCKKHRDRYHATIVSKRCEEQGCDRSIEYSSWYVQQRGQAPPAKCSRCKLMAGGRATDAKMLIYAEKSAPGPPVSFEASKGLSALPGRPAGPAKAPAPRAPSAPAAPRPAATGASAALGPRPSATAGRCPNGHDNVPGSKFCCECGAAVPAPQLCPNGHEVPPHSKFCKDCGAAMQSQVLTCSRGHVNAVGSKFCQECSEGLFGRPGALGGHGQAGHGQAGHGQAGHGQAGHSGTRSQSIGAGRSHAPRADSRCDYPSRQEYLASPDGSAALERFLATGKDVGMFKRFECARFAAGECTRGGTCHALHNEFPSQDNIREVRTAVKYRSREEYLASPEGQCALAAYLDSGRPPQGFKQSKCKHFSAGHCRVGLGCGFVHNEFPVEGARPSH